MAKRDQRWMVPTRRLGWVLAPMAVASVLLIWVPTLTIVWSAALAFALILGAVDFALRPPREAIRVRRHFCTEYRVGHVSTYELSLTNETDGLLATHVREVLPAGCAPNDHVRRRVLAPGDVSAETIEFVPQERGRFQFLPTTLRIQTRLGLFAYQESADVEDELLVYPGRPSSETAILLHRARLLDETGARTVRRRGHESDFESLRDYVVGDDIRFVDWKATARRCRPQIRQFQMEKNAEVILAVDCGRLMGNLLRGVSKLDLAITPVLDLATVAIQRGERVGLLTFDSDVLAYVPPRGTIRQIGLLTEALANLQTGFRQTSFTRAVSHMEHHHKKRSVVVVFTDFTDELSSHDLQQALLGLSRRHVLLFVAVGDPHLQDILAEAPRDVNAVFQKGAAAELLVERRRILHSMSRAGILAIDADPFTLTAPLLSRYLEARARL